MEMPSFLFIHLTSTKMPIILHLFIATLLLVSCGNRSHQSAIEGSQSSPAEITFADTLHDFGTFPADSARREYVFAFTNTGDGPVAVVDVAVSCRCLSAEYTRTVVRPGESGQVTLVFDGTKSAPGYFDKSARVRFNSPRVYTLRVRGRME